MNKYHITILSVVVILILIFTLSACNSDNDVISENDMTTAQNDGAVTTVSDENNNDVGDASGSDNTEVYYTRDDFDLEIVTIPDEQYDTSSTDATQPTVPEPTFLPDGEKIELPFIPAN